MGVNSILKTAQGLGSGSSQSTVRSVFFRAVIRGSPSPQPSRYSHVPYDELNRSGRGCTGLYICTVGQVSVRIVESELGSYEPYLLHGAGMTGAAPGSDL